MWTLAVAALASPLASLTAYLVAAQTGADPLVTTLASQGVLGVVVYFLWREYRDEKDRLAKLTDQLLTDIVPLLTRATEAIERAAAADRGGR